MKMVTFEEPVRATIQGDGVLLGMPMTFVRLHGCDYSCSWCDTKDSWKPGSVACDMTVDEVAAKIAACGLRHVAITGGNPLVQEAEVYDLLLRISPKHHVLLETQASIASQRVFELVNLASISPKLHDWRWEPMFDIIDTALESGNRVQIKVVTTSDEQVDQTLAHYTRIHARYPKAEGISYILLPEYSLGRPNVKKVNERLFQWMAERDFRDSFDVRIVPQIHKLALFVS